MLAEIKPETWAWSREAERQRAEAPSGGPAVTLFPDQPAAGDSLVAPLLVGRAAVIYLIMAPHSADHAAQTFRTEPSGTLRADGLDNYWFAGHCTAVPFPASRRRLGAWARLPVMGPLAVIGKR